MSDYIEMLVAAGWVKSEDLDEDYLEHKKSTGAEHCSYDDWKWYRKEWQRLNEQYETEVAHYYAPAREKPIPYPIEKLSRALLNRMMDIEVILGY